MNKNDRTTISSSSKKYSTNSNINIIVLIAATTVRGLTIALDSR